MRPSVVKLLLLIPFFIVSCSDLGEIPVNYHNKILFSSSRSGTQQLYMVNPDGSDVRQLTFGQYANGYGIWSPDARHIVFWSSEGGSTSGQHLFRMNSDGTDRRSLGVVGGATCWGRDNLRILYVVCPLCEGGGDVSLLISEINADGSGAHQLTSKPSGVTVVDAGAVFAADGTKIYFNSNRFDPSQVFSEIYVMNDDGSDIRRLTYTLGGFCASPAISPDGTMIAFASRQPGKPRSGIYIMKTDTTALRLVIEEPPTETYSPPRWSPSGAQLVFTSSPAGQSVISFVNVVNIDGTGLRRLVADSTAGPADWSW